MAENGLTSGHAFQLEAQNTTVSRNPLNFLKTVKARKASESLKIKKQAKRRVQKLQIVIDKHIFKEGDVESSEKVFQLSTKHIAAKLNNITVKRAGVTIRPFEAVTLAALEEQADLTYRQSIVLRYFLKDQGAGGLFDSRCSEKKVKQVKKDAGSTAAYTFNTANVFVKNGCLVAL